MSVEHLKEKQAIIDEIKGKLDKAQSAVVIDYIGITVAQADAMRRKLREADIDYTVYKNKLASRAVEGTQYEPLKSVLAGPSAFAFSYEDAVAPARVISGIIKEYKKMEFKAGVIEGTFYDADGVKTIAALPSREELLAKFLGSVQSPVSKFVRTLQAIVDANPETAADA
jgi:large subunit ribosomal protein L10